MRHHGDHVAESLLDLARRQLRKDRPERCVESTMDLTEEVVDQLRTNVFGKPEEDRIQRAGRRSRMAEDRTQIGVENILEVGLARAGGQHMIEKQLAFPVERTDPPLEQRPNQYILRTKMVVHGRRVHAHMTRHRSNRGGVEALPRKEFFGGVENQSYGVGIGHAPWIQQLIWIFNQLIDTTS